MLSLGGLDERDLRWRKPPRVEIGVGVRGVPRLTVAVKRGERVGGVMEDRVVKGGVAAMKARRERSFMAKFFGDLFRGSLFFERLILTGAGVFVVANMLSLWQEVWAFIHLFSSVSAMHQIPCRRPTDYPDLFQPLSIERQVATDMPNRHVLCMSRAGGVDRSVSNFASWLLQRV